MLATPRPATRCLAKRRRGGLGSRSRSRRPPRRQRSLPPLLADWRERRGGRRPWRCRRPLLPRQRRSRRRQWCHARTAGALAVSRAGAASATSCSSSGTRRRACASRSARRARARAASSASTARAPARRCRRSFTGRPSTKSPRRPSRPQPPRWPPRRRRSSRRCKGSRCAGSPLQPA